jgi:hypothetical protein
MDSAGPVRAKVLRRAAELLGGTPQLRKYLRVSALSLSVWISGAEAPPTDVFLRAVDVIDAFELKHLRGPSADRPG